MSTRATFTSMNHRDWSVIMPEARKMARALPDRIFAHLQLLDGDFGGFPIDRLSHCLQTATLAHRDGRAQAIGLQGRDGQASHPKLSHKQRENVWKRKW